VFFSGNSASQGFTNSWYGGYLEQCMGTDGSARGRWLIRNTNEQRASVEISATINAIFSFRPADNNVMMLGLPNQAWKDCYTNAINGLNPGALSLPSNSFINVDTTDWDLTCSNRQLGSFTPTADGWLMLHVNNSGTNEVNFWIIGGVIRINNKSTINTVNNDNFNMITIPVEKDKTYNIYGNASEYVAGRSIGYCRFMPCQGNV
jgi:hypothetical protein